MDNKVIQAGRLDDKSTQEEYEEFLIATQRSILEADQEEENEEAGDMNDGELNEMLARNDKERELDALDAWRAIGNGGKLPSSLMQLEELPKCYQTDEPFEPKEIDCAIEGRGQRRQNVINYNDSLNDEQWLMAWTVRTCKNLLTVPVARKNDGLPTNFSRKPTPSRNTLVSNVGVGRKEKMTVNDYDAPGVVWKPKRGIKSMSATPSVIDDDDKERDMKRRKPDGRKRCELFRELPNRGGYPDCYELITHPIALSTLRKRGSTGYYKSITHYKEDWKLVFDNARTALERLTAGTGLPGTSIVIGGPSSSAAYDSALTPMDEDERPQRGRAQSAGRRQLIAMAEGPWEKLSNVAVPGAKYDSPERVPHAKCLKGTWIDLLEFIHGLLDKPERPEEPENPEEPDEPEEPEELEALEQPENPVERKEPGVESFGCMARQASESLLWHSL
ncbi:hypothetical protein BDR04DRAFT_1235555 [Suillus decipiens]|nr:hypothetical protein BDR04DRAFT_1235555 [Suillus decipiens]